MGAQGLCSQLSMLPKQSRQGERAQHFLALMVLLSQHALTNFLGPWETRKSVQVAKSTILAHTLKTSCLWYYSTFTCYLQVKTGRFLFLECNYCLDLSPFCEQRLELCPYPVGIWFWFRGSGACLCICLLSHCSLFFGVCILQPCIYKDWCIPSACLWGTYRGRCSSNAHHYA